MAPHKESNLGDTWNKFKHILPNGALMVIYHRKKNTLNKSKLYCIIIIMVIQDSGPPQLTIRWWSIPNTSNIINISQKETADLSWLGPEVY